MFKKIAITAHPDIIAAITEDVKKGTAGIFMGFDLVESDIMPEGHGVLTDYKGNVVGIITPPKETQTGGDPI